MRVRGVLLLALLPATAGAQVHELRHDVPADLIITTSTLGVLVASELAKGDLGPRACRWCDREKHVDHLNLFDRSARRALRWEHPSGAARASDALAFLGIPALTLGGLAGAAVDEDASRKIGVDTLVVVQSAAIGALVNQAVKFAAARERPFAHAGQLAPDGYEGATPEARYVDENLSFYSGHTSVSFALANASGMVATLRGYRLAPALWATGVTLAAVTGWLRMAADRHYFTDVLVGALMGSAAGILLPLAFHGREQEP